MVNHINQNLQRKHIVTIENPIEFLHRDVNCSVTQREVGRRHRKLRRRAAAALRQDPDVIVIGEMADAETARHGHQGGGDGATWCISTMPTPDVTTTVERVHVDVSAGRAGDRAHPPLPEVLRGVVSQQLLPRKDDEGRVVAAVEVLVATPAVRAILLETRAAGRAASSLMAEGANDGMQTFEQHLPRAWSPAVGSPPRRPEAAVAHGRAGASPASAASRPAAG